MCAQKARIGCIKSSVYFLHPKGMCVHCHWLLLKTKTQVRILSVVRERDLNFNGHVGKITITITLKIKNIA